MIYSRRSMTGSLKVRYAGLAGALGAARPAAVSHRNFHQCAEIYFATELDSSIIILRSKSCPRLDSPYRN